jgi:hypothetical protein
MDDNDKILLRELTGSYTRQLGVYRELGAMVQKLLSRLVLSRGDTAILQDGLVKKRELLDRISAERAGASDLITSWQQRKAQIPAGAAEDFTRVLADTEQAIREFLTEEDQLKRYIEGMMKKGSGPA